jgi:hypothetical protein
VLIKGSRGMQMEKFINVWISRNRTCWLWSWIWCSAIPDC